MLQQQKKQTETTKTTPTLANDPNLEALVKATPEHDEVTYILNRAADYLELHGWIRGKLVTERVGGPTCLLGAVGRATWGDDAMPNNNCDLTWYNTPASRRINATLKSLGYSVVEGGFPSGWNDNTCRSKEDAVAVLRLAAEYKGGLK